MNDDEQSNPVKDYLFEYIEKNENINQLISQKKFDEIINQIVRDSYEKILNLQEKDVALSTLATGILHYLLTNALLESQRKITINDFELDIVIPNMKTLEKDPKMALVIYIPKSTDENHILEQINHIKNIQPISDNIWLVLSKKLNLGLKTFVLNNQENSFSKIIFEIAQFSNVNGDNKFKILRI